MPKNTLVLLDLDTAVFDTSGDLNENIVCFLSDAKEKNILVAVFSNNSAAFIDTQLKESGLDIHFSQENRFSYPDLLAQGRLDFPLPDPYFYQYCAQALDTFFERTIGVTGEKQTATTLKSAGIMPIAITHESMSDFGPYADCVMVDYTGFAQNVAGVIYWWDRHDHHDVYIPDPTPAKPYPKS